MRPLIVITNDDGIEANGINELVKMASRFGDIVVVAPDGPRSGMSSAISAGIPLRLELVCERDHYKAYRTNGTPVDCIKLSMHQLFDRKPDLLLSGINHGSNAGVNVLYSGTMGAAFEGCVLGIPSVGFSYASHHSDADLSVCRPVVEDVCSRLLHDGMPSGVCLNINVPAVETCKGIRVSRQAKGYWTEEYVHRVDPSGRDYYWLTGRFKNLEPDNEETDEWALSHGYVSLVPCSIDTTAESKLKFFDKWIE